MRTNRLVAVLVTTLCAGGAYAQAFEDDGETGTVLTTDSPPGKWEFRLTRSGSAAINSTQAARRGARGLRMDDNSTGSSPDVQTYVSAALSAPATSQYHLRFWVRPTTSNGVGDAFVGSIRSASQDLVNLQFRPKDGNVLSVGGFNDNGTWSGGQAMNNAMFTVGTWHLVEMSVRGVGTTNGSKQVFLDGALVYEETGIDWSSWDARRLMLGVFWSEDLSFRGQLDYDDVRGATTEHASTLSIGLPSSAAVGDCVPIALSLKASNGIPRNAPYSFGAQLSVSGATGSFYSDAACSTSTTTASFSGGMSAASAYFKPASTGAATISASHVDLLPASSPIQLNPAVVMDAGMPDAGGPDAGDGDGGFVDGGLEDGGSEVDAGVMADAGNTNPSGPIARVTPAEQTVAAGTIVTLDASGSTASGGFVKARHWSLVEGPAWVELAGDREVSLKPDVPGTYVVQLVVTDALDVRSEPVRARIVVEGEVFHPPEELGGCGCTGTGSAHLIAAALAWALAAARRKAVHHAAKPRAPAE